MRIILALPIVLAACGTTPETPGSVYEMNDRSVTIRGVYDMSLGAGVAKPTAAMVQQARDICAGAEYVSANPYPHDNYTFLYLFRC